MAALFNYPLFIGGEKLGPPVPIASIGQRGEKALCFLFFPFVAFVYACPTVLSHRIVFKSFFQILLVLISSHHPL